MHAVNPRHYIIQEGGEFAERLSYTHGFVWQRSGRTSAHGIHKPTREQGAPRFRYGQRGSRKESALSPAGGIDDLISGVADGGETPRGGCTRERCRACKERVRRHCSLSLSLQYGQTIFWGARKANNFSRRGSPRRRPEVTARRRHRWPACADVASSAPAGGEERVPLGPVLHPRGPSPRPGCAPFILSRRCLSSSRVKMAPSSGSGRYVACGGGGCASRVATERRGGHLKVCGFERIRWPKGT